MNDLTVLQGQFFEGTLGEAAAVMALTKLGFDDAQCKMIVESWVEEKPFIDEVVKILESLEMTFRDIINNL